MGDDGQNGQTLSNISIIPLDFWNRESVFPKRSCNESIGCLYTVGYFSPRVFYEPTSLGKKGFSTTANIPEDLGVFLDLMELESTGRGSNRCIIYTYIYIWFTTKCYPFTREPESEIPLWEQRLPPPGLSRACDTSIVERLKSPRFCLFFFGGKGWGEMGWSEQWCGPLKKFGKHLLLREGLTVSDQKYLMYSTLGLWAKYVVICVRSMEVNIWDSQSALQLSVLSTVIHKSLRLRSSDSSAQIAGVTRQLLAVPTGHLCHPTLSFQIQHSRGVTNRISPGDAPKMFTSVKMSFVVRPFPCH